MRMTKKNKLVFDQIKEEQKLKQVKTEGNNNENENNDEENNQNNKTVKTQSIKLDQTILKGKFDFDKKNLNNNVKKSTSSNFYTNVLKRSTDLQNNIKHQSNNTAEKNISESKDLNNTNQIHDNVNVQEGN